MSSKSPVYYAGFWLRYVAAFIDTVITVGISIGINLAMGVPFMSPTPAPSADAMYASLFGMVATFLYFTIFQGHFKGTPGKHLLGLTLLDEKSLDKISIGQSVGRYFMHVVSMICLGIGLMSVGWHKKKQGWHDRSAGTVVVKKKFLKQLKGSRVPKARPAAPPVSKAA